MESPEQREKEAVAMARVREAGCGKIMRINGTEERGRKPVEQPGGLG